MSDDSVLLTQSILIRGLTMKQYNVLVDISLKLNSLRNCAVEKTPFVKSTDRKHFKKINFKSIISKVKEEFKMEYSFVQAHLANAAIKKHVESFNSYVELKNKKIDGEYDQKVNPPKKHENYRLHNIIIPRESITSSKKKLREGFIELPLSRNYKKLLESKNCRPRIKIPGNIRDKKIIQVEIIPINNGKMFKANFTYEAEKEPLDLDKDKIMGIDPGVNNFATIVTTEGPPCIVDGRKLKNQIYFKCKKTAHYQSILNKQGRKTSNRIQKINQKFKNIQDNFLNQTVNFIIKKCKEQDVGTIVLGYNNNFQHKTNMGKKQNQIFSHIAFKQFKQKLETRCQIHEIDLIIQEESYTSQSSFLDEDILPEYQEKKDAENKGDKKKEDKVKYEFKGNRVQRGLYETQNGKIINADVNAAANIIRKCKHRFNFELLCKWVQTTPSKIKL